SGSEISGDTTAGCSPVKKGAPITIQVDDGSASPASAINLKPGSKIHSNSCSGGDIVITALKGSIDSNGTVESVGSLSGVGANQPPGGGTITIKAFCTLLVS